MKSKMAKMKKKNKEDSEKDLQYYRDTLKKKNLATNVIGLDEFVKRFKKHNPHVDKIVHNWWYEPNEPHQCFGNALYMATILLPDEFHYVEGVIRDGNKLFHHAWLYSKTLNVYCEPTVVNKGLKYFISDRVDDLEKLFSMLKFDKDINIYTPTWIHEGIKSSVKIKDKR